MRAAERPANSVAPIGVLRRMVCALTLVPIVFSAAFIGQEWLSRPSSVYGFDNSRWFNLVIATLTVACSILVWRSVIVWTFGRTFLTAAVGMIPFVQVLLARPLWDAGCIGNDMLRLSQEQVSIGVWVWLMVWVWWGWERFGTRAGLSQNVLRRLPMIRGIKLVVASIGTIPLTVGVFFIVHAVFDDLVDLSDPFLLPAAYLITATVAVGAWLMIWRRDVHWKSGTTRRTVLSVALFLGLPIAGTFLVDEFAQPVSIMIGLLPVIGWGLWMAATMWLWPLRVSSAADGAEGPACVECGYLLKGLTKTRCPECGAEPTLDELWERTRAELL